MKRKNLKTLKDLKEIDGALSGCLTPEDGEEYNYAKGEPKYHTAYKVGYSELRKLAKEWIKFLEKESYKTCTQYPRGAFQAEILREIFNIGE